MPRKAASKRNAGREAGSVERGRMKSPRKDEPSLRDLRRRLVGNKGELLKRLVVTVCAISVSWVVASHVNLRQLASEYPAATANSRAAMTALATNARDAAGNVYAKAGSILSGVHLPAAKSVAPVATHEAHSVRRMASTAYARKLAMARLARRHAVLHEHMLRRHGQAVAAATASASVMGDDWGNSSFDDFTTQFGIEVDKAGSMLSNLAYDIISLNWAPGLRDWLSGEIQSATDSFDGTGTFRVNGLSSLMESLSSNRGLVAAGAGLMMFMFMVILSGSLRRSRRDVNGGDLVQY